MAEHESVSTAIERKSLSLYIVLIFKDEERHFCRKQLLTLGQRQVWGATPGVC